MSNDFSTKDLYLAAALYSKGVKFLGVDRDGRLCWFIFEDKVLCEEIQQKYFSKTLEVNAKEYSDSLRTLKDLVFAKE